MTGGPETSRSCRLTLSMVVRNEASRYLRTALREHRKYIDAAVIIDDASTDESADICLEELRGIPVTVVKNETSRFANEVVLRKQQWEKTVETGPDWILNLDADEWFERRFAEEIRRLLSHTEADAVYFRLYDFWSETHYRDDRYWQAHQTYRPFLIRYRRGFSYAWNEIPQHCGRFPVNVYALPYQLSELRLKHFGWARPEDRMAKFRRYMQLDPLGQYGWREQYLSILDEHPHLVPWVEAVQHEEE